MENNNTFRNVRIKYGIVVLIVFLFEIIIVSPNDILASPVLENPSLAPTTLGYSTYLGGSNADGCKAMKQVSGFAIVTGYTASANFPTTAGSYDTTINNTSDYDDVFVTICNSNGSSLLFSTFLGGSDHDWAYGISVDDLGYIYVTGGTYSTDFPTVPLSFDTTHNGDQDAYVVVLLPDGSDLLYSTFLGGAGSDYGEAVEVASGYRAVIVGETNSSDFPTNDSWDKTYNGNGDMFITVLNATGTSIFKSTYFGGSEWDAATDLVLNSSDDAHITGFTASTDFPTHVTAYDNTHNGSWDGFLVCMNPMTQSLQGSTYFGGSDQDAPNSIAMGTDPLYVYITGLTYSTDFPTLDGYDNSFNGFCDAFLTKFSFNGGGLFYSTYLGGTNADGGNAVSVDAMGNAYIAGNTESTNFPTTPEAFQISNMGSPDVFFSLLNIDAATLDYSTYLGGNGRDEGNDISINGSYEIFIAGMTESSNFPTSGTAFDKTYNGSEDGFVCKLNIPASRVDINLCQGLNLISYPYKAAITNADALLNSICPGNADSIWKYDCSSKMFTSWTILDPGDGWPVNVGMPVWVNITNPAGCTWSPPGTIPSGISYNTCVGLNLVTIPVYTQSITTASQMLTDITGCTAIYRYKKEVSCANPGGFDGYFTISKPGDDFTVLRGHAYWASTTTASIWTPPNP